MRKVEVASYSDTWKSLFQEETERLQMVFGSLLVEVHHIGSTSVPGLAAKPIIDILGVVEDIQSVDRYERQMQEIGYTARGEHGIPNRRFFEKGGDARTHHVHIFPGGSFDITRHLAFRDYLRAHAGVADRYGQMKKMLATRFPSDIESYIGGKHQMVSEIERAALKWYLDGWR